MSSKSIKKIAKELESKMIGNAISQAKSGKHTIKCPKCGSETIVQVGVNTCQICGAAIDFDIKLK